MNIAKPNKRRKKKSEPGQVPKSADWPLSTRPGFLVRRLHQIHISLFMEACAECRITPLQYSVLSILAASGPTDQTKLAAAVALDRTTTTGIAKRLHAPRVNEAHDLGIGPARAALQPHGSRQDLAHVHGIIRAEGASGYTGPA